MNVISKEMEQLKLSSFVIFLFFLTECLNSPTKSQDVDNLKVTQKFIEDNVGYLTIISFAQYVQEASFEEVEMLVKAMTEYRDQCLNNSKLPQCSKLPNDALLEAMCAMEGVPQKHNFSHCCDEVDFKRLCFFHNKKADVGFLPPLPTLDPEVKCQAYKDNSESFLRKYLYEVSRRNPYVFAPTLLTDMAHIEGIIKTCCEVEEQYKADCFRTKTERAIIYLKALSSFQINVCGLYWKFPPTLVKSTYLVILSQKFPKIKFEDLTSILEDVSSKYSGCCEGDTVQCIQARSKVMSNICSKQGSISSKIKECCGKKIPERGECIINMNNDDKPMDLSLKAETFTENKNVCGERNAGGETFMYRFLYEYSRRHQELSTPELLRITSVYEDLVKECCEAENPPDCYSNMENKFNETTEKSRKIVQQECERFYNLKQDDLKNHYLIKFTKMAPQLSTDELTFLGEEMVIALLTCCTLSEEFGCTDNLVDLVIGAVCGVKKRIINPAVDHCCKTNFAFRRHCFEVLEADKTYVPPSASQGLFTFHTDLCQAHKEELQKKKDRFLVNLVKLKPELTDEKLRSSLTEFTSLVDRCCKVEEPESCFKEEGPKLAAKNQAS